MADFSSITLGYNTGTDASPTWTGTALALNGSSGANELRLALSGTGASGSTASASWPYMNRPASGTSTVSQLWAFTADTTGNQIATYTGDNTKANVLRWVFSADGNPVSAMQLTYYADNTHTNPSAGTQPPGLHNDAFTNGQSSDTSSTSYIKTNAYGSGLTNGGTQETPSAGSVGTNPSATTGAAGSATTSAGAWLSTWQSAQGTIQYITGAAIPKPSTAFFWYCTQIIFLGANISTGTWVIVFDLSYSYS